MPASFVAVEQQVVGPFEHQRLRRKRGVHRFDEGQPRDKRQALRRWVGRAQLHERAAEEIAWRGKPGAALAALAGILRQSDEPIAFDGRFVGDEVGVGRAGALDNADAAQKSEPAARSVSAPSGPINR